MIVRLSGDKYINTKSIKFISRLLLENEDSHYHNGWILTMGSNEYEKITQQQFDELMAYLHGVNEVYDASQSKLWCPECECDNKDCKDPKTDESEWVDYKDRKQSKGV